MSRARASFPSAAVLAALAALAALPATAIAQTSGFRLEQQPKPIPPEGLHKIGKQGNVVLIGRLDTTGRVQDIIPLAATNLGFVESAVAAVKNWKFRPAMRGGRPIDVAVNLGVRFRIDGPKRGDIPRAIVGDLSVFPANASGAATSPDGFPIRRGADARLRAEIQLDLPLSPKAQSLPVRADALSPTGRRVNLYSGTVAAKANAQTVPIVFSAPVGSDWEDGIWSLQLTVADTPAGGGQFWLAGNPEKVDFAALAAKNAAAAAKAPPPAAPPAGAAVHPPPATPAPKKR
jgi:protein TonB